MSDIDRTQNVDYGGHGHINGGHGFVQLSNSTAVPPGWVCNMPKRQADLLKGTLDLLLLKTLAVEPRHGIGVADRIQQITRGTFQVRAGSLFPALHRLEQEGYIAGEWSETPAGHRAKYYRITPSGQRRLTAEKKNWSRIALAIAQVLEAD